MKHQITATCRHLGPHESSADHWMLIGRYESPIDGSPIAAIANLASTNSKVSGDAGIPVAGIYIIRADIDPRVAVQQSSDSAICGSCPQRRSPDVLGGCYVTIGRGPLAAYQRLSRGEYRDYDVSLFAGLFVRFGEYGDPACMPIDTIADIVQVARGHTGYTHMWTYRPAGYARYLMASVEHETGAAAARAKGYRTFRTRSADAPIGANEFACPAAAETGHRLTCSQCGACNGSMDRATRANPVIIVHGVLSKRAISVGV